MAVHYRVKAGRFRGLLAQALGVASSSLLHLRWVDNDRSTYADGYDLDLSEVELRGKSSSGMSFQKVITEDDLRKMVFAPLSECVQPESEGCLESIQASSNRIDDCGFPIGGEVLLWYER
jgi:hypothetical protein